MPDTVQEGLDRAYAQWEVPVAEAREQGEVSSTLSDREAAFELAKAEAIETDDPEAAIRLALLTEEGQQRIHNAMTHPGLKTLTGPYAIAAKKLLGGGEGE